MCVLVDSTPTGKRISEKHQYFQCIANAEDDCLDKNEKVNIDFTNEQPLDVIHTLGWELIDTGGNCLVLQKLVELEDYGECFIQVNDECVVLSKEDVLDMEPPHHELNFWYLGDCEPHFKPYKFLVETLFIIELFKNANFHYNTWDSEMSEVLRRTWLDRPGEVYNIHLDKCKTGLRINIHRWLDNNEVQIKVIEGDGQTDNFVEHERAAVLMNPLPSDISTVVKIFKQKYNKG